MVEEMAMAAWSADHVSLISRSLSSGRRHAEQKRFDIWIVESVAGNAWNEVAGDQLRELLFEILDLSFSRVEHCDPSTRSPRDRSDDGDIDMATLRQCSQTDLVEVG